MIGVWLKSFTLSDLMMPRSILHHYNYQASAYSILSACSQYAYAYYTFALESAAIGHCRYLD